MTIYEEEDFDKSWDPRWMKFNNSVDRLKRIRAKIAHDEEKKKTDNVPTSLDLEKWFRD